MQLLLNDFVSFNSRNDDWLSSPSPGSVPSSAPPLSPSPGSQSHNYNTTMSNGYSSPMSNGSYDPYSPNGKIGECNVLYVKTIVKVKMILYFRVQCTLYNKYKTVE